MSSISQRGVARGSVPAMGEGPHHGVGYEMVSAYQDDARAADSRGGEDVLFRAGVMGPLPHRGRGGPRYVGRGEIGGFGPKARDECGVIGVHAAEAASLAILGLQALQHRGQESAGVASFDGAVHLHKAMGLVAQVFASAPQLPGDWAVGHNRYSTCGTSCQVNAGPFLVESELGPLVLAHNGNIVNAAELRSLLAADGLIPESDSDSELLALLLSVAPGGTWPERIRWMAERALGSYSLVLLAGNRLYGVRDPMGNRPLSLGRLPDGWVLASESCAFSLLGGRPVRDLQAGEILEIDASGPKPAGRLPPARPAFCVFEYIYIARPDTIVGGRSVHAVRRAMGEQLGLERPAEADLVIGVPDSGTSAALGYSTATGIPFGEGLIKNRYIGRTFIQPAQTERERLIRMKFGVLPLKGKRIVLVDDSIVRGNTLRPIVKLLREAGAAEIHARIASPPLTDPCYLGVDMASREELIANRVDEDGMAAHAGADSLYYLSLDGLLKAVRGSRGDHCLACFTGRYPEAVSRRLSAISLYEDTNVAQGSAPAMEEGPHHLPPWTGGSPDEHIDGLRAVAATEGRATSRGVGEAGQ